MKSRRRRLLLAALVLSLLIHAVAGGLLARLARLAPHAVPPDDAAAADRVAIERIEPTPRPTPTPVRQPTPTPTPIVRPRARPALPRTATAPRIAREQPPPAPAAPREIARVVPHAPPEPRAHEPAHTAFSQSQIDAMNTQFRSTIASAQQAVAQGPAASGGSDAGSAATTMKRYTSVSFGSPADVLGGGLCDNLSETTHGDRTYIYWQCRIHYDDGYTETVAFPWPFVYSRGHTPRPREPFPEQPPPQGFQLPQVFALSREVCYYFRDRCDAVIRRERADYGTPP